MGKVVLHMNKAKKGTSGGLTNHIDRTQKVFSENIDRDRSHLNFSLVEKNGTIDQMVNKRIAEGYKGERAIRKDAVTNCRFVLSGSHKEMSAFSYDQVELWAYDSYKFFEKRHGAENIVRAEVHMDEKTPHMHLVVVPLTDDGKLSATHFFGTRDKLKQLQTDYANQVGKSYGLERGVEGNNRKHLTTKDYYRLINENELTAEKIAELGDKEIIGKLIELADENNEALEHIAHKKELSNQRTHEQEGRNRETYQGKPTESRVKETGLDESFGNKQGNDKGFGLSH